MASAITPLVRLDGVWKKFHRGEVHDSLRDLVPALVRRALGRGPRTTELRGDEFWAVRDLSFEVEPGQAMGVIGPNGAGKSTVLKLLTRILRPTRGAYRIHGRVGALIEVAAGFHPDLTGMENIFLQGAIMGMSATQIKRKLEAIIAFSEVEEFIFTPVKRYSSGMNARLGFSIAAHLDPDVLIIDEVLAVGDVSFQRKAFGRIRELAKSGMPVVVVSHQLDRIAELCTDAILLSRGRVLARGTPAEVIGAYMRGELPEGAVASGEGASPVTLESAAVVGRADVGTGERVRLRVHGTRVAEVPPHVEPVGIFVRSAQSGELVYATGTGVHGLAVEPGAFVLDVELQLNVPPGIYLVDIAVVDRAGERPLCAGPSLTIHVREGTVFGGPVNMNAAMRIHASTQQFPVPA
jgi:ABC-type polysaccharide/polyol phosphate transport system ATPase subunit